MNESAVSKSPLANPWIQLILGVICMACVANLQYGWTWFVDPLDAKYHWGRTAIQATFTVFVAIETWLIPVEGYLVDRFGPRWVVLGGGVLVGAAWALNSVADSLTLLYLGAALGGIGTGCVYGTCVGNALKWFPGRRGLAAGITAAGFGAGAALTVDPIKKMIDASGYEHTFLVFGVLQGAIVFLIAWLLLAPPKGLTGAASKQTTTAHGYTPAEVLRSPVFYVLYIMFFLIASGGLTIAASIASIAKDIGIAKTPVALFGFAMPAAIFAVQLNRIFDGIGRPFFGWVSDQIGREYTMAIAFGLGGVAYWLLGTLGYAPWAFVLFAALIFLTWGEIFSLFPSTCTDTFGTKFATVNLSLLYTAKGASAFLVPVANIVERATGGWHAVFLVTAIMNFVVVALALFVLKPMRSRLLVRRVGPTAFSAKTSVNASANSLQSADMSAPS
jgi:MFS transporter, OFA family, oxalate/formate antiporter